MILDHKPHGAQVLKACNAGITEWLYCSPVDPAAGQAVRGGVPKLFPQFENCGTLPKHGFVHNIPWQLVHSYQGLEQINVLYQLDLLNTVKPYWPYAAALELEAQITASILQITFCVTNLGPQPMPWTGGLHPYWKVACLQKTQLFGLLNMPQGFRFTSHGVEQLHQNVGPLYL